MKTIHAVAGDFRQGRGTPLDVLEECFLQIDRQEPRIHAWVLVDRDRARAEARERTEELRRGQWRGPLHGIPLGIKDIFDVFDWPTAAGSKLWQASYAREDSTVVKRLRQAGAVLIGKTVTTAYASFDPPPTVNPWDTRRTPGGSSSGSAAGLACGMCLGAIGSQTGGSITRPASFCGVAGLKPTYGRVSCQGVLPLAGSMDHPGPMARSVRDLAILLEVIAGVDPRDPTTAPRPVPAYEQACLRPSLGPAPRIGRLRGMFEARAEPIMNELLDRACLQLQSKGAKIVEVTLPAAFAEITSRHATIMAVESAMYHEVRFQRHPDDYPPKIRSLVEQGLRTASTEYARTKEHQRALKEEIRGCFDGLDVLLSPATIGPAPDTTTTGDPLFNSPWSYTGLPTVNFPAGRSAEGLPLGIQLIGPAWAERELLAASAWCENALGFEMGEPQVV